MIKEYIVSGEEWGGFHGAWCRAYREYEVDFGYPSIEEDGQASLICSDALNTCRGRFPERVMIQDIIQIGCFNGKR